MQPVQPDANIAILAYLDVVDLAMDGSCRLNEQFEATCRATYQANPRLFDTVVPRMILARAAARGIVLDIDVVELAVSALEIGVAQTA